MYNLADRHEPLWKCLFLYYYLFSLLSDQGVTDHEEPDLAAYAAIDMSTLRDVRHTSMDYVLSMEALMHTTPGLKPGYLKPGYLPEWDTHYLLSGVTILSMFMLLHRYGLLSPPFFQFYSDNPSFLGPQHANTQFLHGRKERPLQTGGTWKDQSGFGR